MAAEYPNVILGTPNLAGYWRLGETSGTTADDASSNGRDGTYAGSFDLEEPGLIVANADPAVGLTGAGGVSLGDIAAWHFGAGDWALELWAMPTALADAHLWGKDQDSARELGITTNPAGKIGGEIFLTAGGPLLPLTDDNVLSEDVVSHVVVQRSGDDLQIWVDGELCPTTPTGVGMMAGKTIASAATPLYLGRRAYAGAESYFTGVLDEAAIYGRALTAADVAGRHRAGADARLPQTRRRLAGI